MEIIFSGSRVIIPPEPLVGSGGTECVHQLAEILSHRSLHVSCSPTFVPPAS